MSRFGRWRCSRTHHKRKRGTAGKFNIMQSQRVYECRRCGVHFWAYPLADDHTADWYLTRQEYRKKYVEVRDP